MVRCLQAAARRYMAMMMDSDPPNTVCIMYDDIAVGGSTTAFNPFFCLVYCYPRGVNSPSLPIPPHPSWRVLYVPPPSLETRNPSTKQRTDPAKKRKRKKKVVVSFSTTFVFSFFESSLSLMSAQFSCRRRRRGRRRTRRQP